MGGLVHGVMGGLVLWCYGWAGAWCYGWASAYCYGWAFISACLGLARIVYMRCINRVLSREITKCTVIYDVYIYTVLANLMHVESSSAWVCPFFAECYLLCYLTSTHTHTHTHTHTNTHTHTHTTNTHTGLYDRLDRIWRVKSKHSVCAISSYDLDGDGVPEMICGWNNGRVRLCLCYA